MKKGIFITGTDTAVGKTTATAVLGVLLQEKGFNVGVMKPVQCAGDDANFLRSLLRVKDPMSLVNPYFAPEPLSPHLAFKRAGISFHKEKIIRAYRELQKCHDIVLLEGAGGLLVPLLDRYLVSDLIRDLDLDVVVVARPGLGTINHTLLTVRQAGDCGLNVRGIVFCDSEGKKRGLPEKTNPQAVTKLAQVPCLGTVPYFKEISREGIIRQCSRRFDLSPLMDDAPYAHSAKVRHFDLWDKKYIWHPFTQMRDWLKQEQLVINRGKGCYLTDTKGRRYLDGVSSLWVNLHGHRRREIDDAVKKQINLLSHSTLLGLSNTPAVLLAKKLVQIAPRGLKKVFYSDNGSTAVEVAVKMAYQYWQNAGCARKTKIVYFENSYHGDTLGSVSIGGIDLFHQVYRNLTFEAVKVRAPYSENIEQTIRRFGGSIAAVVMEPMIQGAAGMLLWPKGLLRRVRRMTARHGIFLIADEVATGFGRTGKMFACEHEGVVPDFLCLAKGITGGYLPLAATLTTQKVYDGFLFPYRNRKTFFHGHTYTGNPLACAAALANLEIFEKEKTLKTMQPKIKFLDNSLKRFYNLRHVGEVRQLGFMAGIELMRNPETKKPYEWREMAGVKVCREARQEGVILRPLGNTIVLMPPLSISMEELRFLLDVTYKTIRKVTSQL